MKQRCLFVNQGQILVKQDQIIYSNLNFGFIKIFMRINYFGRSHSEISLSNVGLDKALNSYLYQNTPSTHKLYPHNQIPYNHQPMLVLQPLKRLSNPNIQQPHQYYHKSQNIMQVVDSKIKQSLKSQCSEVGSSYNHCHEVLEPLLNPPPLPPPQALILSVQVQSNKNNQQQNHIYPDSSCDINDSKSRQAFLKQEPAICKRMASSLRINDNILNQKPQGSKIYNSTKFQRNLNFTFFNKVPETVEQQIQFANDNMRMHLNFRTAFDSECSQTPQIPTFNYNRRRY